MFSFKFLVTFIVVIDLIFVIRSTVSQTCSVPNALNFPISEILGQSFKVVLQTTNAAEPCQKILISSANNPPTNGSIKISGLQESYSATYPWISYSNGNLTYQLVEDGKVVFTGYELFLFYNNTSSSQSYAAKICPGNTNIQILSNAASLSTEDLDNLKSQAKTADSTIGDEVTFYTVDQSNCSLTMQRY